MLPRRIDSNNYQILISIVIVLTRAELTIRKIHPIRARTLLEIRISKPLSQTASFKAAIVLKA